MALARSFFFKSSMRRNAAELLARQSREGQRWEHAPGSRFLGAIGICCSPTLAPGQIRRTETAPASLARQQQQDQQQVRRQRSDCEQFQAQHRIALQQWRAPRQPLLVRQRGGRGRAPMRARVSRSPSGGNSSTRSTSAERVVAMPGGEDVIYPSYIGAYTWSLDGNFRQLQDFWSAYENHHARRRLGDHPAEHL